MSDELYGDVVAVRKPDEVSMEADGHFVRARLHVPMDTFRDGVPQFVIDTDFDMARRMVEGEVSVLFVVSDGEEVEDD